MPFGLTNAPATFQALLNSILKEYLDIYVWVYIDDTVIFTKDLVMHYKVLRGCLEIFRRNRLYANLKKCEFLKKNLRYLGHIIGKDGIQVDPQKTDALKNWPRPTTITQLKSYLGLVNYY